MNEATSGEDLAPVLAKGSSVSRERLDLEDGAVQPPALTGFVCSSPRSRVEVASTVTR